MHLPVIRPMLPADVDPAAVAVLRDDWGDRRSSFAFVAGHAACRPFVADADGAIVGTGVATLNGTVGWIGTIWVDPDWRRRGLGLALTQATVDAAETAGCRTLVLVATEGGRPMYERLGFEVHTSYRIVEAPGLAPGSVAPGSDDGPAPRIRPFRPTDLEAVAALDTSATGEDRSHLLAAFADADSTRCLERDGALAGFVVRAPWGGGATIAPRLADARAILHARRLAAGPDRHVRAGLLAENETGLEAMAEDGWTDVWGAPRLIRGDPLDWRPEAIWGQFNHAMG
jgi:ribosomal protein S18 acetylase RimI-like enzyme